MKLHFYCLIVVILLGCVDQQSAPPPKTSNARQLQQVDLVLNWRPEAEHGGFFAALVHGYYEELGLDVKIIPGGPGAPVIPKVLTQKGSFGVTNADRILLGRAQDADVVAVMAPIQDSPRCIIVRKSSNIKSFTDLKDITMAITATSTFAQFLKKQGLLADVRIVAYNGSAGQFLTDQVDAQQGYVFSEPFVAEKLGGDPHCLMVSELGFNPYTSVLFTHADVIDGNPELVQKMVTASIRGWRKYLEDPAQTNRHIHKLNPEMGLDILTYGAKALNPLCINASMPAEQLGEMTLKRWTTLTGQLVEAEAISADKVAPAKSFTRRFLAGIPTSSE